MCKEEVSGTGTLLDKEIQATRNVESRESVFPREKSLKWLFNAKFYSPEIPYTQATPNGFSRVYLCIYAYGGKRFGEKCNNALIFKVKKRIL